MKSRCSSLILLLLYKWDRPIHVCLQLAVPFFLLTEIPFRPWHLRTILKYLEKLLKIHILTWSYWKRLLFSGYYLFPDYVVFDLLLNCFPLSTSSGQLLTLDKTFIHCLLSLLRYLLFTFHALPPLPFPPTPSPPISLTSSGITILHLHPNSLSRFCIYFLLLFFH